MIKESSAPVERLSSSLPIVYASRSLDAPCFLPSILLARTGPRLGVLIHLFFFLPAAAALMLKLTLLFVTQTLCGWGRLTKLVSVDFCVLNMPYGIVKCYL